jgi:hypothetical protein
MLELQPMVAINLDLAELSTDLPSAVIETVFSILELPPFSLVQVKGSSSFLYIFSLSLSLLLSLTLYLLPLFIISLLSTQVEGTHLDTVTIKLKHITPTTLKTTLFLPPLSLSLSFLSPHFTLFNLTFLPLGRGHTS